MITSCKFSDPLAVPLVHATNVKPHRSAHRSALTMSSNQCDDASTRLVHSEKATTEKKRK